MVKKIKEKKSKKSAKKKMVQKRIGIFYKNIALSFVGAALILSIIVLFFSSAKATITVLPLEEEIKTEFITQINLENLKLEKNKNAAQGLLLETILEKEKTFQVSKTETQEAQATGEVIIINNYSKDQPLVATTRLLSKEGILFRLSNTLRVPAGGRVKAKVYADKPGKEGEIGPTTFTIPGLWVGLQDKIYAISEKPMTGGIQKIGYVTQKDIDQGKN